MNAFDAHSDAPIGSQSGLPFRDAFIIVFSVFVLGGHLIQCSAVFGDSLQQKPLDRFGRELFQIRRSTATDGQANLLIYSAFFFLL